MARVDPARGRLRIIGGSLRGSKLAVPDAAELRPTPDRVRETLFNWLSPVIAGARCLDLYAGTGALGIEALSRGAASVDFVETDAELASLLRSNLQRLNQVATVHQMDAMAFLRVPREPFDIAFLDPPFAADAWTAASRLLEAGHLLQGNAFVYVECPARQTPELPANWMIHRESRAGAVDFALYRRQQPSVKLAQMPLAE